MKELSDQEVLQAAIPIPGYPGYFATEEGGILSTKNNSERLLKPATRESRRMYVCIRGVRGLKTEYVHRLIAFAYHGLPSSGQEVNHIDGDPSNNRPTNLEWVTRSENMRHAFRTGLNHGFVGEANARAKLTSNDIVQVRRLINGGKHTLTEIGKMYGVKVAAISKIKHGIRWRAEDRIDYLRKHLGE